MEIHVKYDSKNPEDIGIKFDGFREEVDLSNPEELIFDSSAIILVVLDGVINQIAKSAPPNKKKELAEIIVNDVKEKIGMYYDDVDSIYKAHDLFSGMYDDIVELYEHVLDEYNINEEKLLKLAASSDWVLDVEKSADKYVFMLEFGDEKYSIGEVSMHDGETVIEVESFKASMFAMFLYDKVFSADTEENPFRQPGMFNLFGEIFKTGCSSKA